MKEDCETTVTKCLRASTPVKLRVESELGDTNIECGAPKICFWGKPVCCRKNSCEFVVEQSLLVEIPIKYLIKADVGESHVEC